MYVIYNGVWKGIIWYIQITLIGKNRPSILQLLTRLPIKIKWGKKIRSLLRKLQLSMPLEVWVISTTSWCDNLKQNTNARTVSQTLKKCEILSHNQEAGRRDKTEGKKDRTVVIVFYTQPKHGIAVTLFFKS